MPGRGPRGVGKTTLPQAGGSALRAGTAGHKALSNLGTSGQRMYHPLRPRARPACREKGRPVPSITSCPESDYAPSWLPDGGPGTRFAITPLSPLTPETGRTGIQRVLHLGEAAMTTLLPPECRFSPTVLSATIPSFRQPRAHCRAAVQDTPALPGYKVLGVLGRGGMATVYKVRQLGTKRLVAVKVVDHSLAGDGEILARIRQEQALAARLRHPNLVAGYGADAPLAVLISSWNWSTAATWRSSSAGP